MAKKKRKNNDILDWDSFEKTGSFNNASSIYQDDEESVLKNEYVNETNNDVLDWDYIEGKKINDNNSIKFENVTSITDTLNDIKKQNESSENVYQMENNDTNNSQFIHENDTINTEAMADNENTDDKKWYQKILKSSEAFDDGYDFGDITKTTVSTVADTALNLAKGAAGAGEQAGNFISAGMAQIADWTGHDEFANRVRKNISNGTGKNLTDRISNLQTNVIDKNSISGEGLDKVTESAGYMATLAAAECFGGAGLGNVIMFSNGAGSAAQKVYSKENVSDLQAWTAMLGAGYLSYFSENIGGHFGSGLGFETKIIEKFSNPIAQMLVRAGINANEEAFEEVVETVGNFGLDRIVDLVGGKDGAKFSEKINLDEMAEEAQIAFATSLLFGGAVDTHTVTSYKAKNNVSTADAIEQVAKQTLQKEKQENFVDRIDDVNNRLEKQINKENPNQKKLAKLELEKKIAEYQMSLISDEFYVARYNQNGELESLSSTWGKVIENPNKDMNITPAIIKNDDTDTYNIIDAQSGLVLDSDTYINFEDAEKGFKQKMKDYSNYGKAEWINERVSKARTELDRRMNEMKSVANASVDTLQTNTSQNAQNKNLATFDNNSIIVFPMNTESLKNEFNKKDSYTREEVRELWNNNVVENELNANQDASGNVVTYVSVEENANNELVATFYEAGTKADGSTDTPVRSTVIPQQANGQYKAVDIQNAIESVSQNSRENLASGNVAQEKVAKSGDLQKDKESQLERDSEDFSRQVEEVQNGTFPKRDMLTLLTETPKPLLDIGLPNLPITMTQRHLDTIMNASGKYKNANYHDLGIDIIKQLPEAISNPLDIVHSNTNGDSIVLTTYLADKQGRTAVASIKIDGKGKVNDVIVDTNVMTSAYGRNNYERWMQDNLDNDRLLYDIDRGVIKKVTKSRLQLPRIGNSDTTNNNVVSSNNSISQVRYNVKSDENTTDNNITQKSKNNANDVKNNARNDTDDNTNEEVATAIERFEKAKRNANREDVISIANNLNVYHRGTIFVDERMQQKAGKNKNPKFINIDEFFKDYTDKEDLRKKAYDYALENYKNKTVLIRDIGTNIDVSQAGLKKTFHQNQDNMKMQTANNLLDIIEEGTYLNSSKSTKNSNLIYHYFYTPISINGENQIALITIREDTSNPNDSDKFYYHDLREIKNIEKDKAQAMPHENVSNMLFERFPSHINNSISQNDEKVKSSDNTIIDNDMQNKEKNTKDKQQNIEDFGEKIGGARKDLAIPRGSKTETKEVIHDYTIQESNNGYAVNFRKRVLKDGFKTHEEAEQYILDFKENIKSNLAYVEEGTNRKDEKKYIIRIRNPRTLKSSYTDKVFTNKQDAESYAIALSMYLKENGKNLTRPQIQKVDRYNANIANATKTTGENILNDFGFKGGEFGNWVKQSERQEFLNYAQDAFTDLAIALDIENQDLGQNGEMNIAFGARGKGLTGAVAHFEPAKRVINMTRLKGAGSLAHEYGHSIDNWLSRISGYNDTGFSTTNSRKGNLSENMQKAIKNVVDSMNYNVSTNQEEINKKNAIYEDNRKESLKYYLKYLDKVFAGEATKYKRVKGEYKKIPIEVTEHQKADYQQIRNILMEGKVEGDTEYKFDNNKGLKGYTIFPEPIDKLQKMYKEVVGRKLEEDTIWGVYHKGKPARQITEVKSESAYVKSSRELDRMMGRSTQYFSKTEEMWARAFEAYVSDKLKSKGITDTYLVHSVNNNDYALFNPFPAGEERQKINKAFDNLIQTMKDEGILNQRAETNTKNKKESISLTDDGIRYRKKNIEKSNNKVYNNIKLDEIKTIPIEEILEYQTVGGYRSEKQIAELKADIERNGIKNPIELARKNDGTIIIENGNHRLQIAKKLGFKEIPIKFVESWENVGLNTKATLNNKEKEIEGEYEDVNRTGKKNSKINERRWNRVGRLQGYNEQFTNRGATIENAEISTRKSNSNEQTSSNGDEENNRRKITNAQSTDSYIEQEIQKVEESGKWDDNIPVTSLTDIRKTIEDYLGLGVKKGHFRQSAYGIYKGNRDVIRSRELKDIDTILHEAGHALDVGKRLNVDKESIANELLKAVNRLEGYEKEPRSVKLEEGFAEVIREYAIIPEQAKKDFPQSVAVIEKIRKNDTEFNQFIKTVHKQTYNYIHQKPQNRLHSNESIGKHTDERPITKESIKNGVIKAIWDKDYMLKKVVSDLEQISGEKTNVSNNAYLLARLSSGIMDKATSMLSDGYIDENGKQLTPGLNKIGKIIGEDEQRYNDLRDYLIAKRALDYRAKKLKSGLRYNDVMSVISQFKNDKQINEAAQVIYDTLDGVLQYAVDNRLISADNAKAIRESSTFYVPMQRVLENDKGNGYVGAKRGIYNWLKKRTGSELDIKDILENIVTNSTNIIQQVENNNVLKALYNQGESAGLTGAIYDVIPAPMMKTSTQNLKIWENELQNQGINTKDLDLEKTIDLFAPNTKVDRQQLITSFINDNGKRVYLQFNDKSIFNSIVGMDKNTISYVLKMSNYVNIPLRAGATVLNWGFAIPNIISDTQQAMIYSEAGFTPVVDNVMGMIDIIASQNETAKEFLRGIAPKYAERLDKLYKIYKQSGAMNATRLSQYRKATQTLLKDVYGTKNSEVLGVYERFKPFKRFIDILGYLPELSEQSTRFRTFEKNYDLYKENGDNELNSRIKAAIESRDATQDFGRMGFVGREINQLIPFSAARLGASYTFTEKVKKNPTQIAFRTAILIALSLAIKSIGEDDDEIKELNQRKKDDNYVIRIGDTITTWKKPQGILRSIINIGEYAFDLFAGNIEKGKEGERLKELIEDCIMDNLPADEVTGLVPNGISPLVENAINKDLYYNTEIVKSYDVENLPPYMQYYDYNSQLSILLGKIFNYSPAKIDNLISGYFAALGTTATKGVDILLGKMGIIPEKPEMGLEDNMIGKRFVVNVNTNSQSVNDIYEIKTELTQKKGAGTLTEEDEEELSKVTEATSNMSKINKQIKAIKSDLTISGKEKANQIRELQEQRTDIARQALGKELIHKENEEKIEQTSFYPTSDTLSKNNKQLELTDKMKEEYTQIAYEYYTQKKNQGLYSEEKLKEFKSKAKDYAKKTLIQKYKSQLVKTK